MALRKVKARLLKLNDILDGEKSDSDSSSEQKAPDIKTTEMSQTVPPPMPQNLPPLPASKVAQTTPLPTKQKAKK